MVTVEFLHDPFWQFLINVVVALFVGAAAIIAALIIARKQQGRKSISWEIVSNISLLPVSEFGEQLKNRLQILFDSKPVDDLSLVDLKIWNSGSLPIKEDDYEHQNPMKFSFGEHAKVLDVEILGTDPKPLEAKVTANIKFDSGNLELKPILLNDGDIIKLKLLIVGFRDITIDARISGVKEFRTFKRRTSLFFRGIIFGLMVLMTSLFLLIYFSVNWFFYEKLPIITTYILTIVFLSFLFIFTSKKLRN